VIEKGRERVLTPQPKGETKTSKGVKKKREHGKSKSTAGTRGSYRRKERNVKEKIPAREQGNDFVTRGISGRMWRGGGGCAKSCNWSVAIKGCGRSRLKKKKKKTRETQGKEKVPAGEEIDRAPWGFEKISSYKRATCWPLKKKEKGKAIRKGGKRKRTG